MIKCGTINRPHSLEHIHGMRHDIAWIPYPAAFFLKLTATAAGQSGVWTEIPPGGRQVAGCSVERDRRAFDIISLPLLLAMLSPCRSPSGRSRSLALPLDGRVERHKLPPHQPHPGRERFVPRLDL